MGLCFVYNINVREYRRGNQNRQYRETGNIDTRHKTKTNKTNETWISNAICRGLFFCVQLIDKGNNKITELRTILQSKVKTHDYINDMRGKCLYC